MEKYKAVYSYFDKTLYHWRELKKSCLRKHGLDEDTDEIPQTCQKYQNKIDILENTYESIQAILEGDENELVDLKNLFEEVKHKVKHTECPVCGYRRLHFGSSPGGDTIVSCPECGAGLDTMIDELEGSD